MIHKADLLNVSYLKAHCTKIHFFGLGFIQVKLDDDNRVHFYTKKWNATTQPEDIHNHRYNFQSHILKGELYQQIFEVTLNREGSFTVTKETCNPDNPIEFPKSPCSVQMIGAQTFAKGSSYWTHAETFHRVEAVDTVTWLERNYPYREAADVVHHPLTPQVCPFSVKITDEELWAEVERLCNL